VAGADMADIDMADAGADMIGDKSGKGLFPRDFSFSKTDKSGIGPGIGLVSRDDGLMVFDRVLPDSGKTFFESI
jgi:hypothetical protein